MRALASANQWWWLIPPKGNPPKPQTNHMAALRILYWVICTCAWGYCTDCGKLGWTKHGHCAPCREAHCDGGKLG